MLLINKMKFSKLCDCVSILYQVEDLSVKARNDRALLIHPFKCKRFGNNHEDKGMTRKLEFFYEPLYGKKILKRCVLKSMLFWYQLYDALEAPEHCFGGFSFLILINSSPFFAT